METNHYNLQQSMSEMNDPSASSIDRLYPVGIHQQGGISQNGGHHHYPPRMLSHVGSPSYTLLHSLPNQPPPYEEDLGWKKVVPVKAEPSEIPNQLSQQHRRQGYMHEEGRFICRLFAFAAA